MYIKTRIRNKQNITISRIHNYWNMKKELSHTLWSIKYCDIVHNNKIALRGYNTLFRHPNVPRKMGILGLNWRVGVHFGQNVAKNTDYIKKYYKQKLFRIKLPTKNSVDASLSPAEAELRDPKIAIFTRLRSRRVVMCLVVCTFVRLFVRSFLHRIMSI